VSAGFHPHPYGQILFTHRPGRDLKRIVERTTRPTHSIPAALVSTSQIVKATVDVEHHRPSACLPTPDEQSSYQTILYTIAILRDTVAEYFCRAKGRAGGENLGAWV
jgi:hypothetical protein